MKKVFCFIISLLMFILVITSCSDTPPTSNPANDSEETTEPSITTSDKTPTYTVAVSDNIIDDTVSVILETRIKPLHPDTKAGIFIGSPRKYGLFGYYGYAVLVEGQDVTLYRVLGSLRGLANTSVLLPDGEYGLRITLADSICRVFIDVGSGFDNWPLLEYDLERTDGFSMGTVELFGNSCAIDELKVTFGEAVNEKNTYTNPVLDGYADPDVLLYNGTYYLYGTGGPSGYQVYTSKDLNKWTHAGLAVAPELWGITTNYWAPDVEYVNGKFYMVVSCNENLGIAVSDSPLGPFKEAHSSPLFEKSIDGHIFVDDDGSIYLFYVSFRSGHKYGIYGVKLNKDMTPIMDTETLLITATEPWEKDVSAVAEGPFILKRNGLYYMTYSGSNYLSPKYAVGYAISSTPLGQYTKYENNPILIGNSQVNGTGHHCITTSLDSSELWIVYHQHNSITQVHERKICIDRIRFRETDSGIDILEVYGPTRTPQAIQ